MNIEKIELKIPVGTDLTGIFYGVANLTEILSVRNNYVIHYV